MANGIHERIFSTFPAFQILAAVVGSAGAFVSGIPELAYNEAMGGKPWMVPWDGIEGAYAEYGGSARFLPTLVSATLNDGWDVVALLGLFVAVSIAYVVSVQVAESSTRPPILVSADGKWCRPPAQHRRARRATIYVLIGFCAVLAAQIASRPLYAAAMQIRDLGRYVDGGAPPWDNRGASLGEAMRGWWSGGGRYRALYSNYFGLDTHTTPRFPSAIPEPDALNRLVDGAIRLRIPTAEAFRGIVEYYDELATWTVWTLLILVALTVLGSAQIQSSAGGKLRPLLTALVLITTCLHALQWLFLASAYGRVYVTARAFERAALEIVDGPGVEGVDNTMWPFWQLELPTASSIKPEWRGVLAVKHYWPMRRAADPMIEVWCQDENSPRRELARSMTSASPHEFTSGMIVFPDVRLDDLRADCATYSQMVVYDGFSQPRPAKVPEE